MIEKLQAEIENIERILANKKAELKKMITEESLFSNANNKLIVLVEMHDQFSGITDVLLINNNEVEIKNIKAEYDNNFYSFEVKIFKSENLREDFKYLKLMLSLASAQDDLYEWMEENENNQVI